MDKEFIQLCKDGDVEKVPLILQEKRANVNVTDSDGMTGLMYAAYNGHTEMCSLLLENGAEVDKETTKDYFTALMLATLAGRGGVVELLLRAGANQEKRNKSNKNAANLAGFVGSKECLRIINNFLPLSELVYHTVPRGLDESDFLPPELALHLHYLCCMNNLNPVKMLLYVKENPAVADPTNKAQINRILDRLTDKQFKIIINELMAFKIHYIMCILEEVHKRTDGIDGAIRYFLLGRKLDGFPINIEQLVRRAIRTFKFVKSQLVIQLVRTLAPITPGAGKPALYFVMTTLNGRHVDVDEFACRTCGEMNAEKRCSACKQVFYCNATCQKMHWFTHKKVCESLSKRKPKCQPVEEEIMMPPPPPPQQQSGAYSDQPPPPPSQQQTGTYSDQPPPPPSQQQIGAYSDQPPPPPSQQQTGTYSDQPPPPPSQQQTGTYSDQPPPPPSQQQIGTQPATQYSDQPAQLVPIQQVDQKPGDVVLGSNDAEKGASDHVKPSEFLIKEEPGLQHGEVETGVNIVVKEEVLDSNIIPTS